MSPDGLNPGRIMDVGMGFWPAKVLQSAAELELFTSLGDKSLAGDALGGLVGLHARATYDFLDALVALGFLDRDGDGAEGRYRNSAEAALFLDKRSPAYMGGILEMCSTRHYRFWADLTEALRTGQPQGEQKFGGKPMFDQLYLDPDNVEVFLRAMEALQGPPFAVLADTFDFSSYQRLCDVGGGAAQLSRIVAARHAGIEFVSFDLPAVTPLAEKEIAASGLADRITAVTGDFFADPLPRADVITMGNVLHDWNLDKKLHLIRAAYDALPEGGAFIVVENLIDDARRENAFGLLMSLNMMINFGDAFDFTGADLSTWCRQVGFREVEIRSLAGPTSAGIAYK